MHGDDDKLELVKDLTQHANGASSREITLAINEIQLLLAEKRTALSLMRTGIAVCALPLSVLSILIATSKYYAVAQVLPMLAPVLFISLCLVILAIYLVARALAKLHVLERLINKIKRNFPSVADLVT